jgi:hypothetical protein
MVVDTTPPELTLPADNTLDATSPSGAQFLYEATAVDLVDGSVPTNCFPTSGTIFAIGSTVVNCGATDSHGNQASGSFQVIVKGASEQLEDLSIVVSQSNLGPGSSFTDQILAALSAARANDKPLACADLQAFINHVQAQNGKKLTADQASSLISDAKRIMVVLGC